MGKALLFLVLGSSIVLARQLINTSEHEARTGEHQLAYQEEVIAREIAASAFNVAMGEIRAYGEDVKSGADAFNGDDGGRSGTYATGRFAGGSYTTHAELTSGHSVRVIATGTFGDAEFTMHDEYRVPVLIAREDGIIEIEPNVSDPDVCSALFYQAYPLGTDEGDLPDTEMIFASWNGSRSGQDPLQSIYATAGTQMNFILAIDADCSEAIDASVDECDARSTALSYVFNPDDWDELHYALDVNPSDVDQAEEGDWAIVEQDATDRQSWRVSWEDTHDWNAPTNDDPLESLQALKSLGYSGTGWSLSGSASYFAISDHGDDRPDFADQSLTITVYDINHANFHGKMTSTMAKQKHCGEEEDEPLDSSVDYDYDGDGNPEVPAQPEPDPDPTATEPEPQTTDSSITQQEMIDYACACTSNGTKSNKTAILHRPPGNEANEQLICIGTPAVDDHFRNHNDVFPTCEAGSSAVANNKKKKK